MYQAFNVMNVIVNRERGREFSTLQFIIANLVVVMEEFHCPWPLNAMIQNANVLGRHIT